MNRFEFNTGDHKEEEEKVLVGRSYGKEVLYRFRKNKGCMDQLFYYHSSNCDCACSTGCQFVLLQRSAF